MLRKNIKSHFLPVVIVFILFNTACTEERISPQGKSTQSLPDTSISIPSGTSPGLAKTYRSTLTDKIEVGKTVLLASHNTEDIEMLCDTVCEMDAGKLEAVSRYGECN